MTKKKFQLENQDEIQLGNQDEIQLGNQDDKFLDSLNKNIACNIFKEQFDLINELPEKDRAKVLYLAVFNAFYKNSKNQDENQLDYQDENTYISISISISKYLSNISKSVLNLLYKTIVCKNYNKNWGGGRPNAGRKSNDIQSNTNDIERYPKHKHKQITNNELQITDNELQITDNISAKNKNVDLFINEYKTHFEQEYKRVFKNKPYLSKDDCYKIIELSKRYDCDTITQAIEKLKDLYFEDIDFKPSASWLLSKNNFEKLMNGEFDKVQDEEFDVYTYLTKLEKEKELQNGN